jgi:hypothetical protein
MSDIKIIKVATGGASKVDSSGFFIKPKQPSQSEPSQLSQFIQKENEREGKKQGYEEDEDSVDSMTVSDVSSATNQSDEEYTNESMTPAPLPAPSSLPQRVSSIIKDETLNSYLEKPKVESQPSSESLNTSSPISIPVPNPSSPAQTNNVNSTATATVNELQNNNAKSTTAQPDNNRNDYYSDTEEDVIDMTDNKLYDILASVLEDEDGENVSENMAKMNRNLEKVITMFEAYQQNNAKDEYLSKIGEAIENQNKILSQIVRVLEKQNEPNQDANVAISNQNVSALNENNKKKNKHEKPKSSSESSSESDKGENTNNTENTNDPNIKKVKISESLKHSTSTSKKEPLKHRIQIKRKT